ncbi:MAG: hypothetical protein AB1742_08555 [bacterium]
MRVWSKGLGNIELILDFEKYRVERENSGSEEKFFIKGMITDPVVWDFRITMTREDIPGLLHIALNQNIMLMFLKNLRMTLAAVLGRLFFPKKKPADEKQL